MTQTEMTPDPSLADLPPDDADEPDFDLELKAGEL